MIPGSANSLLLASAAADAAQYQIERSLRFNSADSAYLSKVFSAPTDAKKQTYSFWLKRTGLGQIGGFSRAVTNAYTGGSTASGIYFDSDSIQVTVTNAGDIVKSTAVFRDPSAWYQFVVAVDTTQATASNRVRIYANGVEITSFSTASYPALNASTQFANSSTSQIATLYNAGGYWLDGYLAEFYFIDGQALDPTNFGYTDSNGIWQPKAYTGTYGTNGFHLDFADNSAATTVGIGKDVSGNGNDWTVNNISILQGNGNFISGMSVRSGGAFDGNLSTYSYAISNTNSAALGFTFNPPLAVGTALEVRAYSYASGPFPTISTFYEVNGTGQQAMTDFGGVGWQTLATSGTVSTVIITSFFQGTQNPLPIVYAFRLNGVLLVDNFYSAGNDSLVDTPTNYGTDTEVGSEVRGNYATLNPLDNGGLTLANGNLDCSRAVATWLSCRATVGISSGKWYWEISSDGNFNGSNGPMVGIGKASAPLVNYYPGGDANGWGYYSANGLKYTAGIGVSYGATWTGGDIIGVAFDADNGTLTFYKNNSSQGTAFTGLTSGPYFPMVGIYGVAACYFNFGQRSFAYTAPSGYKALCTQNLSSTTITTSGTYTGNGVADGPFVYLNGVPTAMTVNGNTVTFGTEADKLSNGFKVRTASTTYNQNAATYNYSITSTGDPFKVARAQSNP